MMKLLIALNLLSLCAYAHTQLIDLESGTHDIVCATKRIMLPEYPHAFNPSLTRWCGKTVLSFRIIPDPQKSFVSYIGIVELDADGNPCSVPQLLPLRDADSPVPSRIDDARLLAHGDTLYIIYSDNEEAQISKGGFRVSIAELYQHHGVWYVKNKNRLSEFEGNSLTRREKNWVPFIYHDELLLAYSLTPHKIFYPIPGAGACETVSLSERTVPWKWGELRGGTQALRDGDHYLSFFHSAKKMITQNSFGKEAMHYFIGAYTFEAEPPFTITQVSAEPIVGRHFYHGEEYKPYWGSIRCVFPCGCIMDDRYVWISYGRQDHELWIAQLDKQKLYESLVCP